MELHDLLSKALEDSLVDTLSTTLSLTPELQNINLPFSDDSIISSVGLTGIIAGTISICITNKNAAQIVSKMLDMEIEENSADVNDGIGEIVNMVAGGLKSKASAEYIKFDISIPTTVSGSNLSVNLLDGLEHIRKSYACNNIELVTVLTYKKNEDTVGENEPSENSSAALSALDKLKSISG